ncbi:hypothetical protein JQN63_17630 [Delftia lacustris]|uniref:Uncharacterized protein n=1 Tax=Delftia tsuruhatensis TaxID=180282 RepID=A0ABM6DZP4_9BURK|nr:MULTISPECIES: hypothetical protein [Delftia]AOV00447.1 hypothetical protein BI380_03280 [Delftia tsuruhatensis]QRI88241.1 hypothetical protein JQN63_17630 [Delftia lacustris]
MRRGRSPVADFFNNFNAAYDTTAKVGRDIEVANAVNAKPTESQAYTEEQGKELEGLAAQGYKIDFDQAKNAYVASNEAGDAKTMAMQGLTTNFMGKQLTGGADANKAEIDRMRSMSVADAIAKHDPEAGMRIRGQVEDRAFKVKEQARAEKGWAREDGIEALDKQLGDEFETGLMGADGQRRKPTFSDFLGNQEKRAFMLHQAGYAKEANEAAQKALATSYSKAQLETEERKQALGPAVAAFASGNYAPAMEYLNRFGLGGASKVTGIERGKDGGIVMNMVGVDGKAMEPVRTTAEQADAMLRSTVNPAAIYQLNHDNFQRQLQLNQDRRSDNADRRGGNADARAAAAHSIAMEDRRERLNEKRELREVREAMARESNPSMSDTQIRAVRAGIMRPPGADNPKAKYDYDPVKVQKAFGTTEVDPLTQKETVKRNQDEERRFREFMADNPNIRDVDEGLVKFNASEVKRTRSEKAGRASAVQAAMTPEAIAATAKKHSMSEEQVQNMLRAKGLIK